VYYSISRKLIWGMEFDTCCIFPHNSFKKKSYAWRSSYINVGMFWSFIKEWKHIAWQCHTNIVDTFKEDPYWKMITQNMLSLVCCLSLTIISINNINVFKCIVMSIIRTSCARFIASWNKTSRNLYTARQNKSHMASFLHAHVIIKVSKKERS